MVTETQEQAGQRAHARAARRCYSRRVLPAELTDRERRILDGVVDYEVANPAHHVPMGEVCMFFPLEEEAETKSAARSLVERTLLAHREAGDYGSFSATPEGLLASHRAVDIARLVTELLRFFHARIAELRTKFDSFTLGELTLTGAEDFAVAQLVVCAFELRGENSRGTAYQPGPKTSFLTPNNVVDLRALTNVESLLERVRRRRAKDEDFFRSIGIARAAGEPAWDRYPPKDAAELVPLLRRGAFDRDVAQVFRDRPHSRACSLVIIDIDHFKMVIDSYGHPTGDAVLVRVAQIIRSVTGRRGRAYRYGGEELVVLLPDFTNEEAFPLVERIRAGVEAEVWPSYAGLAVTVSAGIADDRSGSAANVLEAADRALYEAKHGGRNRTCVARPAPAP
jgi:diguanylate cyclase (GGDEF)-like protein